MSQLLQSKHMFKTDDAETFRRYVLAGCRHLDVDEIRFLADDLHECAQERRGFEIEAERRRRASSPRSVEESPSF